MHRKIRFILDIQRVHKCAETNKQKNEQTSQRIV